ncbi:hypothetical protein HPQ64_19455 [Rhizobiales bacterium]|uniref:hypothetical protein n=1 Tax=Hongsoonwoonella zoysiae TaxID=2821844 RepID=UPI00155FF687|nr:hypothetical protein [Hongsoonwoonella zoysiae]NRG19876.1 hypothetical protein [Hongsoonwoonella zoysiae]
MANELDHWGSPSESEVRDALQRLLASPTFARSRKISRLITYLVEETLQGRAGGLKEMTIALEVFDQTGDFNPRANPIVRVNASRLRSLLRQHYSAQPEAVEIRLPSVGYVPNFTRTRPAESHSAPMRRASDIRARAAFDLDMSADYNIPASSGLYNGSPDMDRGDNDPSLWARVRGTLASPLSIAMLSLNIVIAVLFSVFQSDATARDGRTDARSAFLQAPYPQKDESVLLLCHPGEQARATHADGRMPVTINGRTVSCRAVIQAAGMFMAKY